MTDASTITQASYQITAHAFATNVANLAPVESIQTFLSLLPANPTIMDIGSGSGRDAKIFTQHGAKVLGIDYSSELISIAKSHAPDAVFKFMDIRNLNLPGQHFDGIWAACTLAHIPKAELPAVLLKIHSLLKSNGHFYLALKKGQGEGLEADTRYEGNPSKFWAYYQEPELKKLLKEAGFKILIFDTVEKKHEYHSHDAFRVFCQKI